MESPYFHYQEIEPGLICIFCSSGEFCWLIVGSERALLVDTGAGIGNLRKYVELLTPLPCTVVNTHGHVDHAGGDFDFDEIYLHPADRALLDGQCACENRIGYYLLSHPNSHAPLGPDVVTPPCEVAFLPLGDGDRFNLGGREIEVLETPGHTQGSVCLLDRQNRFLLTGDTCNPNPWIFLSESASLEEYRETLKRLRAYDGDFDRLLFSHAVPTGEKTCLYHVMELCDQVLSGALEGMPYDALVGTEGRIAMPMADSYHRQDGKIGNLVFNPRRLYLERRE